MSAFQTLGGDEKCVSRLRSTETAPPHQASEAMWRQSPPRPERQISEESRLDLAAFLASVDPNTPNRQRAASTRQLSGHQWGGSRASVGVSVTHFATFAFYLLRNRESFWGFVPAADLPSRKFRGFRIQVRREGVRHQRGRPEPSASPQTESNIEQT